jgi:hypothetical protein
LVIGSGAAPNTSRASSSIFKFESLLTCRSNLTSNFHSIFFSDLSSLKVPIAYQVMTKLSPDGDRIFIAVVTGGIISTAAVLIRFYCQYITPGFQLDDAWMVFTMLAYYASAGATLWGKFGSSPYAIVSFANGFSGLERGGAGLPTENLIQEGRFDEIRIYLYVRCLLTASNDHFVAWDSLTGISLST